MNAPKLNPIAFRLRRSGPIRHESLSPKLLARIKTVHRLIGKYLGVNLEQFEISFMREESPDTEVVIWHSIAMAWGEFHKKHVGRIQLPHDEEKMLIAVLFAISKGIQQLERLGVPVEVGSRLLACYEGQMDL
jgi:hypothetical protein